MIKIFLALAILLLQIASAQANEDLPNGGVRLMKNATEYFNLDSSTVNARITEPVSISGSSVTFFLPGGHGTLPVVSTSPIPSGSNTIGAVNQAGQWSSIPQNVDGAGNVLFQGYRITDSSAPVNVLNNVKVVGTAGDGSVYASSSVVVGGVDSNGAIRALQLSTAGRVILGASGATVIGVVNVGTGTIMGIPGRPAQGSGRVAKFGFLENLTASATAYTVTSGKTLYVTDIVISAYNAGTAGLLRVRDGGTLKIPISLRPTGINTNAATTDAMPNSFVFQEPREFSTSFNILLASGTITYSASFGGYEE